MSESPSFCSCTVSSDRTLTQLSDRERLTKRHFQAENAPLLAPKAHTITFTRTRRWGALEV